MSVVAELVREHLADEHIPFVLFTSPPRCVLKDMGASLFDLNLVPNAVIRCGPAVPSGDAPTLAPEHIESAVVLTSSSNTGDTAVPSSRGSAGGEEKPGSSGGGVASSKRSQRSSQAGGGMKAGRRDGSQFLRLSRK